MKTSENPSLRVPQAGLHPGHPAAVVHKNDPPYTAVLIHTDVDRAVVGTLVKMGWLQQDLCDGLQEVRCRAIAAFRDGLTPPPTVGEMKAFCARIARNYVIDLARPGRRRGVAATRGSARTPTRTLPLPGKIEQRDPVDAERQLAVAKSALRRGQDAQEGRRHRRRGRLVDRARGPRHRAAPRGQRRRGATRHGARCLRREIETRGMGEPASRPAAASRTRSCKK